MNDGERWRRTELLFAQLIELPAGERTAHLAAATGDDAALRDEVRALLRGHAEAGDDFLAPPEAAAAPGRGLVLAGCRLDHLLGEGGMGTVWRAHDLDLGRDVAVKVLHGGVLSRLELQRFEQEAMLLARLRHPSIATIHRSGRAGDGALAPPFFVFELVENGAHVTTWAAARGLDRRARVGLLAQIADAVQHAHQRGVVHRDLKPANVLVGDDGVPKVIDFGIARSLGVDDRHTQPGQLLGSIAWMSPEQCAGDAAAIDARTDVHALALLGIELLTGQPAFAVAGLPLAQALRTVAETLPRRARQLDPSIDRDLDAVLGKACCRVPDDRYASAGAFADDLRAWLAHRPVTAAPPRAGAALRRFVRRNPALAATVALAVLILLAGVVVSTHFALAAAERAAAAERERNTTQQLADSLQEIMRAGNLLGAGREVTMREALDAAATTLARRPGLQPAVLAELHLTLGGAYRSLGRLDAADTHLRTALDLLPGEQSVDTRELEARIDIALAALRAQQQHKDALPLLDRAEALLLAARGERATALAELRARRGGMLVGLHRAADGERVLRDVLPLLAGGPPTPLLAECQANLGTACFELGRLADAESAWRAAIAAFDATVPQEHPFRVKTLGNLANVLRSRDPAAAVALAQEVVTITERRFPDGHTDTAQAQAQLAFALLEVGDRQAAEARFRAVVALRERLQGARHAATLSAITDLGYCLLQFGEAAAARRTLEPVWRAFAPTPDTAPAAAAALLLGLACCRDGAAADGEALLRTALATRSRLFGADNTRAQIAASALGECLLALGRRDEAEPLLRTAAAAIAAAFGDDHRETRAARARLERLATVR